jgi:hypothetical protein
MPSCHRSILLLYYFVRLWCTHNAFHFQFATLQRSRHPLLLWLALTFDHPLVGVGLNDPIFFSTCMELRLAGGGGGGDGDFWFFCRSLSIRPIRLISTSARLKSSSSSSSSCCFFNVSPNFLELCLCAPARLASSSNIVRLPFRRWRLSSDAALSSSLGFLSSSSLGM